MKGLSLNERRDVWNAIADYDIAKICEFSNYCKNTKITKVISKGKNKGKTVQLILK